MTIGVVWMRVVPIGLDICMLVSNGGIFGRIKGCDLVGVGDGNELSLWNCKQAPSAFLYELPWSSCLFPAIEHWLRQLYCHWVTWWNVLYLWIMVTRVERNSWTINIFENVLWTFQMIICYLFSIIWNLLLIKYFFHLMCYLINWWFIHKVCNVSTQYYLWFLKATFTLSFVCFHFVLNY